MNNNIILIGMPGAGKSTVGVVLAKAIGYDFIDSDLLIQAKTGKRLFEIINEKGIMVIPDILANAGGVTVSYFEWVQNRTGYKWTLEQVNRRSDRIMKDSFDHVYQTSQKYKVSLRIAAYIVAIDKVSSTYKYRGGY